ncbi:MAG TPA: hypothetical protein VHC22_23140 [Pirellulales bacterium]|nr:hypothetical protein [Pirellulales bacterium]
MASDREPPRQEQPAAESEVPEQQLDNEVQPTVPNDDPAKESPATKDPAAEDHETEGPQPADPLGLVGEPSPKELALPVMEPKQELAEPAAPVGLVGAAPQRIPEPEPEPPLAIPAEVPKTIYAERTKPKTPEWLAQYGGTLESQTAVDDGLNWLARHQGEDGHWGADCLGDGPDSRCDREHSCDGPGGVYEAAHTGMALLAFLAAGNYPFNGQKYSDRVAHGLDYLVGLQSPDGWIVGSQNPSPPEMEAGASFQQHFMYEHAIATFALCEACAVAVAEGKKPDTRYLSAATRAVGFIERQQHNDGGWRYTTNPNDFTDCSVSGWVMLALKTAREAKIDIDPRTIVRMNAFFTAHHVAQRTYYFNHYQAGTDAMTGVGMMAIEFFQKKPNSTFVTAGAAYLADTVDGKRSRGARTRRVEKDYYLWYNCTMAMFQAGGKSWERWNGVIRDRVIALQISGEGCERGSWEPNDRWGSRGGRIYSTALAVLTLEVYYRFERVQGQPEEKAFFKK